MCVADNALQLAVSSSGTLGPVLDLAEARKLAISRGFTFEGVPAASPDWKRANLAGAPGSAWRVDHEVHGG